MKAWLGKAILTYKVEADTVAEAMKLAQDLADTAQIAVWVKRNKWTEEFQVQVSPAPLVPPAPIAKE